LAKYELVVHENQQFITQEPWLTAKRIGLFYFYYLYGRAQPLAGSLNEWNVVSAVILMC
jgi:hypothetical protein